MDLEQRYKKNHSGILSSHPALDNQRDFLLIVKHKVLPCQMLSCSFKKNVYMYYFGCKGLNKSRKIHSILTYKMENNRLGYIDSDKNGCKNIQKVFEYYMKNNERPENYRRGQTLQNLQTASELPNCS